MALKKYRWRGFTYKIAEEDLDKYPGAVPVEASAKTPVKAPAVKAKAEPKNKKKEAPKDKKRTATSTKSKGE